MEVSDILSRENLLQNAQNLLSFLEVVDQYPGLCRGPLLKNAVRRYEQLWLPLAAAHMTLSTPLAAPFDIAWVWHTHVLATSYYVKDCTRFFDKVVDHKVRIASGVDCSDEAHTKTKELWQVLYPEEPFNVDLSQPLKDVPPHHSRLQYNLEVACQRQFKFYYSVSLPHYRDYKFLQTACERYQEHLQLMKENPDMASIPCRDVDLMWHTHRLSPLTYRESMLAILGRMPSDSATETHCIPLSRLHDSERASRRIWSGAGKRFERPGTIHRGEPPEPVPPPPMRPNPSFSVFEYKVELLQFEADLRERGKTYLVQLEHAQNKKPFFKKKVTYNKKTVMEGLRLAEFNLKTGTVEKILLRVYEMKFFRTSLVATKELDLQMHMRSLTSVQVSHEIDINKDFNVKMLIYIFPPRLVQYPFTVHSIPYYVDVPHAAQVLSCASVVLPPSAMAQPMAPCMMSNQEVTDIYGREVFTCRVIQSSATSLSAIELIDRRAEVVATAHVLDANTLPTKRDVTQAETGGCITADFCEGERAVLIRGNRDWAICVGKWITLCRRQIKKKYSQYLGLKVFKLQGTQGWCAVRKFKEALYLIQTTPGDKSKSVYVNLTRGEIVVSPSVQDIPEAAALGFSVAILHLLCQPYEPESGREASPSFFRTRLAHPYSVANENLSLVVAVGYLCSMVPTNEYIKRTKGGSCGLDMFPSPVQRVRWHDVGYRNTGHYFRRKSGERVAQGRSKKRANVDDDEDRDFGKETEEGDSWGDVGLDAEH